MKARGDNSPGSQEEEKEEEEEDDNISEHAQD